MKPYKEKTKSGDINWRVAYWVKGRRVRQTFDSKTEAEDWARINRGIGIREGRKFQQLWLSITPKEQHETLDALSLMRAHRKKLPKSSLTLVQAAAAQIAIAEEIQSSLLLAEAIDRYLLSKQNNKRKGSVSDAWYVVLDKCLHRAARELPEKTLAEFTTGEIEDWLDDQDWSPRHFNNYRDYLYAVFKWASPKFVRTNPVQEIEKYAKKFIIKEVIVPTSSVVTRLLWLSKKKKYRHLRPALDMGFGLAMRSSEITKIDWIDIREALVYISRDVGKGGRSRNIPRTLLLEGVFRSLLSAKGNNSGRVMRPSWRRDLTDLFMEAGMGKPRNIMRRSGGSYYYHATGSEAQTHELMGHTEDSNIFGSSYQALRADPQAKTPISQRDGVDFFAIWNESEVSAKPNLKAAKVVESTTSRAVSYEHRP